MHSKRTRGNRCDLQQGKSKVESMKEKKNHNESGQTLGQVSREESPSLETFLTQLDEALGNLI